MAVKSSSLTQADNEKSPSLNPFEIPKLLKEREDQKKREFELRNSQDVQQIAGESFTREEALEMEYADDAFLYSKQQADEEDTLEQETAIKLNDIPMRRVLMKHQEYRSVTLGPEDLLKNGQMV